MPVHHGAARLTAKVRRITCIPRLDYSLEGEPMLGRREWGDMRREVQLELEEGMSQNIQVELLDPGRLRLLESPMVSDGDLRLGTVVEVERTSENDYRVVKILSQSDYRFETLIIGPTSAAKKLRIGTLCEQHGVVPEMFIEGVLYLNFPPGTSRKFFKALDTVCDEAE